MLRKHAMPAELLISNDVGEAEWKGGDSSSPNDSNKGIDA